MKSSGRDDDGVCIDGVKVLRATERAILCRIPADNGSDEPREVWVPQSQVTSDSEVWQSGDEGTLVVTHWWAEREGFA